MKNRTILLLLLAAAITIFSGCDDSIPEVENPPSAGDYKKSSEAAILSYTSDAIIGVAVIDPEKKTVTVTVKPMDLAAFKPVITVSDKAVLTPPDKIEDGKQAAYWVTAENGLKSVWMVTINVAYGVSFKIDGQAHFLSEGYDHNTDPVIADKRGNGVPGIFRQPAAEGFSARSSATVFQNKYDSSMEPPGKDGDSCVLMLNDVTAAGKYHGKRFSYYQYQGSQSGDTKFFDITIDISRFGEIKGDFLAAFSGAELDAGTAVVVEGFAKLKVIEPILN